MPSVAVLLADGFETVEALAVVDVLRRAGVRTRTVSTMGSCQVISAQQVQVNADERLDACDLASVGCLVLPGGLPATRRMAADRRVRELAGAFASRKALAASGTAPVLLAELSLLEGRRVSAFPGCEGLIPRQSRSELPVVVDRNLVTTRSVSHVLPYALALVRLVAGSEAADKARAGVGMTAEEERAACETIAAALPAVGGPSHP